MTFTGFQKNDLYYQGCIRNIFGEYFQGKASPKTWVSVTPRMRTCSVLQ